jgi:hypothetical protein
MAGTKYTREELQSKKILELLQLIILPNRLSKASAMKRADIRIIFQDETGYMYEIKGSKQNYFLKIDRKNRALIHNCEDWLHRGMRHSQLCKHFGRIFQEMYAGDAKEILIDLILNRTDWLFLNSDEYLTQV